MQSAWVTDFAFLGLEFFRRAGSRILRMVAAKRPDLVGLFGGVVRTSCNKPGQHSEVPAWACCNLPLCIHSFFPAESTGLFPHPLQLFRVGGQGAETDTRLF